MKNSAELRWFHKGAIPADVKEWFCGSNLCKQEEARTDHYLVFAGSNDVGVKVRDGRRLEIKARLRAPAPFSLPASRMLGRMDAWAKWLDEDRPTAERMAQLRFGDQQWVSVIKDRWLRKFTIADGQIEEVDVDLRPDRYVTVELTEIAVNDTAWWTMAFESFGPTLKLDDVEKVADHFLKLLPRSLVLVEADSMSYPEWLNRLGTAR